MVTKASSTASAANDASPLVYYLLWRPRANRPWQSEELFNRFDAHNRYFELIERGFEAYLEKRQRGLLPA